MNSRGRRQTLRKGSALIAVLAVLVLMIAVFALLARFGTMERNQARAEERRLAAAWLAESGLERAKARLDENAKYLGETWKLSANELGGRDDATIQIHVAADSDRSNRFRVRVLADSPTEGPHRVRQTRTAFIDLKSSLPGANR